jgi:hypothetical protein
MGAHFELTEIDLDPEERCPYLWWGGTRYWCGLSATSGEALCHDTGCSSSLNTWRQDVRYRG